MFKFDEDKGMAIFYLEDTLNRFGLITTEDMGHSVLFDDLCRYWGLEPKDYYGN